MKGSSKDSQQGSITQSQAYDMTDISFVSASHESNIEVPMTFGEDENSVFSGVESNSSSGSASALTQRNAKLTDLSDHDRELRSFPLALTSKLFFLLACTMYLWLSIDDLQWAQDAQSIPTSVLEADDDATWRSFRNAQQDGGGGGGRRRNLLRSILTLPVRRLQGPGSLAWDDLPFSTKIAATTLGHDEATWNSNGETFADLIYWGDLTQEQKEAAITLGYDEYMWDMLRGFVDPVTEPPAPTNVPTGAPTVQVTATRQINNANPTKTDWGTYLWRDLPNEIRDHARILGYSERTWNNGERIAVDGMYWDELSWEQWTAAQALGFTMESWDKHVITEPPATAAPTTSPTAAPTVQVTATRQINNANPTKTNWGTYLWRDLPNEIRDHARTLGYSERTWNNGERIAVDGMYWDELSWEQWTAAQALGFTKETWDKHVITEPPATAAPTVQVTATRQINNANPTKTDWGSYLWRDLPGDIKDYARTLGYTESSWNNGERIAADSLYWHELTSEQMAAATALGFDMATWDMHVEPASETMVGQNREPNPTTAEPTSSPPTSMTPTAAPTIATTISPTSAPTISPDFPEAPNGNWRSYLWVNLPERVKEAAMALGYSEELWNDGAPIATDKYFWDELSLAQQEAAAGIYGYDRVSWNAMDRKWLTISWNELPANIRTDAIALGYNKSLWDAGAYIDTETYGWEQLSGAQQEAAYTIFGYTEETWNENTSGTSSETSSGSETESQTSAGGGPSMAVGVEREIKNQGGGRAGGRGGADDDYVFSVERDENDVWVSKYQIVYFVASTCSMIVGILGQ